MKEVIGGVVEKIEADWDYVKVYIRKGNKEYVLYVGSSVGVDCAVYDGDKESWEWDDGQEKA